MPETLRGGPLGPWGGNDAIAPRVPLFGAPAHPNGAQGRRAENETFSRGDEVSAEKRICYF